MVSRYSVIQYVPNPISGERINIGVLAFDDDTVLVRFLSTWTRVYCFGTRSDVSILREFARSMRESVKSGLLFPGDKKNAEPNHLRLLTVAKGWINSIQFTEPRGSLDSVESLVESMAQTYLEECEHRTRLRDRQAAAQVTVSSIRNLLKQKFGDDRAKELLRTDYELEGVYKPHKFDAAVANGKPFFAAHGISFEVKTTETVMDSLAWMIVDVKKQLPDVPLAVIALPPKNDTADLRRWMNLYKETTHTYKALGAQVLEERQVDPWISQQLEAIEV